MVINGFFAFQWLERQQIIRLLLFNVRNDNINLYIWTLDDKNR